MGNSRQRACFLLGLCMICGEKPNQMNGTGTCIDCARELAKTQKPQMAAKKEKQ